MTLRAGYSLKNCNALKKKKKSKLKTGEWREINKKLCVFLPQVASLADLLLAGTLLNSNPLCKTFQRHFK